MRWLAVIVLMCGGLLSAGRATAQTLLDCPSPSVANPGSAYYVGVGNAYFSQVNYTDAIAAYTCAIDLDASYAPAYVRRGYAFTVQGDDRRALADFNAALELDDQLLEAYNNRGVLYMSQGNFGLAIGDFTLVIALSPDDPVTYNNRGIAYAAEGSYQLALADLELAVELDPSFAPAYASLGATYTALAVSNYNTYRDLSAEGDRLLPQRQPVEIIRAVDEDGRIRDFGVWIPFLNPAFVPEEG
ncbi:MAG: tetratricopeptide repeat protein [Chloroflexota bacterium]